MPAEDDDGLEADRSETGERSHLHDLDIEAIFDAPSLLAGLTPDDLRSRLSVSSSWREESLARGSRAGQGWVLREYNTDGTTTGRVIRWHPGGGHHGPLPYWRVSSPARGKSVEIR